MRPLHQSIRLAELAQQIGARLVGDGDLEVSRVRAVDEAGPTDLAFAAAPKELKLAFHTKAGALLVDEGFAADHAHELPCPVLAAASSSRALALAIEVLHPLPPVQAGVHASAVVDAGADVGEYVVIGPLAVIGRAVVGAGSSVGALVYLGDDVVIGAQCRIGVGAVLLAGTTLGARVVIGPGTVIGDEGFVFAPDGDANVNVRHVAGVVIDDDVEIGANVCVDRGVLRHTRIGRGSKVDNLVQIAHDVVIDEDVVVIAQVGIAGDARIGAGAVLAGQSGVKERVVIGKRVRVGGKAGVTRDIADGMAVSGMPAIPHMTWLRAMAGMQRIGDIDKRLRALEEKT